MMTRKKKWWCGTNYKNLHGWVELAQCTCMRRPLYILMCTCNYMHLYIVDVIYNLSVCCYACSKEEEEWANIIGDVLFEEWVRMYTMHMYMHTKWSSSVSSPETIYLSQLCSTSLLHFTGSHIGVSGPLKCTNSVPPLNVHLMPVILWLILGNVSWLPVGSWLVHCDMGSLSIEQYLSL